jgi:hypothetical protein
VKTAKEKAMSRHFAAYFAIIGTLAFAPGGAANAGPFNMPHFNMMPHLNMLRPQPHFNILRPQISMHTPHLSNMPAAHLSNLQPHPAPHGGVLPGPAGQSKNHAGGGVHPNVSAPVLNGPTGQPPTQQQSATGTTSAMLVSNVSGGASGGATSSRFRVIEDGGRFAVVEGRSDTVIKAGFESSKAAWAWIANHV